MNKTARVCAVLILAFLTGFRIFHGITTRPVQKWDEQINAQVVRESQNAHTVPTLMRDGAPFFEKPPLWYFVGITFSHPKFPDIVVLRIISGIFGFGVILTTAWIAYQKWGPAAGFFAWAIMLTTNQLFQINPSNIFSTHTFSSADVDSMYIFFILLAWYTSWQPNTAKHALLTGICSGLAFLTKGPYGIIPLVAATIKRPAHTRAWFWFFLTVIPWHIYMYSLFGMKFANDYVGYHLVTRSISAIEGHVEPIWFYLSVLTNINVFPYYFVYVISMSWILTKGIHRVSSLLRNSLLMSILLFLIPTLMQTKLAWYILPLYPFAALTISGAALESGLFRRFSVSGV